MGSDRRKSLKALQEKSSRRSLSWHRARFRRENRARTRTGSGLECCPLELEVRLSRPDPVPPSQRCVPVQHQHAPALPPRVVRRLGNEPCSPSRRGHASGTVEITGSRMAAGKDGSADGGLLRVINHVDEVVGVPIDGEIEAPALGDGACQTSPPRSGKRLACSEGCRRFCSRRAICFVVAFWMFDSAVAHERSKRPDERIRIRLSGVRCASALLALSENDQGA